VEGISDTSGKDWFKHSCNVLGEMQAKHCMRREFLREACQLADCTPSNLPDRIRKMVVEQFQVEDSKRLREENARLNLEVGEKLVRERGAGSRDFFSKFFEILTTMARQTYYRG
jgi:hypothetical protein